MISTAAASLGEFVA